MLVSNSVWDRIKFRNRTLLPVTTVIPHYYSATIIDRSIHQKPSQFNFKSVQFKPSSISQAQITLQLFRLKNLDALVFVPAFFLFQVDAKSYSSRSDSIRNRNFGNFSLLRQEMIQNSPKSIASKLKIEIQVSVGIFSVNFYDDSRVFFVYLDSFQVLRI